ncbi:MAG: hypothetical protein HQK77_14255 [Desulfobacterales bacterium]|nr:hypothetical protein [Desulfobacterales bacterium]
MFSNNTKKMIAEKVQEILRNTQDPELPEGEIQFLLHVDGEENWSWANIRNNNPKDINLDHHAALALTQNLTV